VILSIVAAHAWCVVQLIILGSLARTVRIRTIFGAMAVGLYLCAPLMVVLQAAWTGLLAPVFGMSAPGLVRIASRSVDPFLEELMKVAPLVLLTRIPVFRRQWSITDFVLIAAATGAGFGLAEDLYRFGGAAHRGEPMTGGWALVYSNFYMVVPGIGHILTSWLPDGVRASDEVSGADLHLVWSAIGGLAVGLFVLIKTKAARLTALGLMACISLDHAAGNIDELSDSWLAYVSWPMRALAHLRLLMPVAALAAAWWLDQRRQGVRDASEPELAAESSASSRLKGTLAAAFSRFPWSFVSVDRLVRLRRALRNERAGAAQHPLALQARVQQERDRVEGELAQWQRTPPPLLPPEWSWKALRSTLLRPPVIVWLIIVTPPVLFFVVGGWPQTAALQAFLLQPAVWWVLFPVSVLSQGWMAWRIISGLRSWTTPREGSVGDEAAVMGMRVACGIGAISLGAFSLLRMLGGVAPGARLMASLHAQDAANGLSPGGGAMVGNSAGAFAPPPPSLDLPDSSTGTSSGASSSGNSNSDSGRSGPSAAPAPTSEHEPEPESPPDADPAPEPEPEPTPPDELAEAKQRRLEAQRAVEAAEIKQATDTGNDPSVMEAREVARTARDAADAADIKEDFKDPWAQDSAADQAKSDSQAATDAKDAAEAAEAERKSDDIAAARADEKQANEDVEAAEAKAAQAQANAESQAQAARAAAEQQAAARQKSADPLGYAADQASKAAAQAQQQADKAFYNSDDKDGSLYREALANAQRAREQAAAARAAADAAKPARDSIAARSTPSPWKPDEP
jgi:hypothetical protein